ncbi:hypothetical protein EDC01DRAFT_391022 [Geopyxis carbonaria]|nr:hypothetical protein EDC01DRAFT_391022 [Geopyxis carbonaria]
MLSFSQLKSSPPLQESARRFGMAGKQRVGTVSPSTHAPPLLAGVCTIHPSTSHHALPSPALPCAPLQARTLTAKSAHLGNTLHPSSPNRAGEKNKKALLSPATATAFRQPGRGAGLTEGGGGATRRDVRGMDRAGGGSPPWGGRQRDDDGHGTTATRMIGAEGTRDEWVLGGEGRTEEQQWVSLSQPITSLKHRTRAPMQNPH